MINWDKHTQHRFGKDGGASKHNSKMQILTAGLARLFVRGKSRVPAPPPKMMETTFLGSALRFCIAGAYIMSPNLSAMSFMKTIFSLNKLAWKLQTHDIQSILNPQRRNHRKRFQWRHKSWWGKRHWQLHRMQRFHICKFEAICKRPTRIAAFMTHFGKIYSATIPDLELLRKT